MSNINGNYINKIFPNHKFHMVENTKQFVCWNCDNCHSEFIWRHELEKIEDAYDNVEIPNDCISYNNRPISIPSGEYTREDLLNHLEDFKKRNSEIKNK
jgi:hypothetical protein